MSDKNISDFFTVLWIQNDLVHIGILFTKSFRIRILYPKTRPSNCQILSVHHRSPARLFYEIKVELFKHFKSKFTKIVYTL
jgi:hypothetical protein